jgi:hypothetical protein
MRQPNCGDNAGDSGSKNGPELLEAKQSPPSASLASAMRTTASALESTWHKANMPVAMTNTRFWEPRLKMFAEYPAPLTRPLKINVEYERLSHLMQVLPQITGSYTGSLSCGR